MQQYKRIFLGIGLLLFIHLHTKAQRSYAANSVLASGSWYKIAVKQEGVYKIDVNFLNALGINTNNLASASIRLYGNGGGMLDENNAVARQDDLFENAIQVNDGGDGIFNNADYFLFYAPGPNRWIKDSLNQTFLHQKNLYSDSAYYFITIGGTGKRIQTNTAFNNPNSTVSSFDERYFYETDLVNLLNSGKTWYGEEFSTVNGNSLSRNFQVDFSGWVTNSPVTLLTNLAGRSVAATSSFMVQVNNQTVQNVNINSVSGYFLDLYAVSSQQQNSFVPNASVLNVNISFTPGVSGAQGWLDWFEVHGRKNLSMNNLNQLFFRDWKSVANNSIAAFTINNTASTTSVWEITNPLQPQQLSTGFIASQTNFINDASRLREYVAFNTTGFLSPVAIGKIANQNLHHSSADNDIIITPTAFLTQANQLASFHQHQYGYATVVATTEQIYNEFGSGTADLSAIRDFIKMYFDKASTNNTPAPQYVTLMGAASFDYKNRIANNTNLVPAYESVNSLDPLSTYVSDDFFAFLKDNDDINNTVSPPLLSVGIGRLPARTMTEAATMVNKIIYYHSPQSFGSWRNQHIFVADNGDSDLHLNDAETIAADIRATNNLFNATKIYVDAYPVVSGTGGNRFPDVNAAIVNQLNSGALLFNYNGHGGYQQLSNNAIFGETELQQLNNAGKLPLFITATCDFAPYDDPTKNALGGSLLYGDSTGAIALMTTTRDVFASSNLVMNDNYVKVLFKPDANGNYLPLGDVERLSKNTTYQNSADIVNNRKFTLLGDPAIRLAFPQLNVQITSINNQPVQSNDTLHALNQYTVSGKVTDHSGNTINGFNGVLYPTVFDKAQQVSTLGNDPASPVTAFSQQANILYKGKATVQNGIFNFSFVMPKDINYQSGNGRLSVYANNSAEDANGIFTNFSTNGANNIILYNNGPVIQPYINDSNFVSGGLTDENPLLLVKLYDSLGINTAGTGIGHDITAVLDSNEKNVLVLNNYYTAVMDSYQQGWVQYQLPVQTEGLHSITIKAWNVADISNTATIQFLVKKRIQLQIKNLFNYPNPFTAKTTFSFEHNQPNGQLTVVIAVFNSNGQLMKEINQSFTDAGSRSCSIDWDGKDGSGQKLAPGLYFYRIIVTTTDGSATATQKLLLY